MTQSFSTESFVVFKAEISVNLIKNAAFLLKSEQFYSISNAPI